MKIQKSTFGNKEATQGYTLLDTGFAQAPQTADLDNSPASPGTYNSGKNKRKLPDSDAMNNGLHESGSFTTGPEDY